MLSEMKDLVQRLTFEKMQSQWMRNMAVNMPEILKGKDIKDLPKHLNESCLVIGAGPSVKRFRQLDVLAQSNWKGIIICADKQLIPLLKRGVKPLAVCTVDGEAIIKKFYDDPVVDRYKDDVKAVFSAVTVHPEVVKRCPFEKYWFVPLWDSPLKVTSLTRTFHLMTQKSMMGAYGNSGACAWAIAHFIGANPIGLIGVDYAYYTDDIRKTTYFESLKVLSGGDMEKLLGFYKRTKTWAGYEVVTDIYWLTYLQMFLPALNKAKVTTYNLSPLSIITNEKVKGMRLEKFLEKFN